MNSTLMHTHQYICGGGEGWGSMLLILSELNAYVHTSVHLGGGGGRDSALLNQPNAFADASVHLERGGGRG